jgi:hypothetical protein
MPPGAGKLPQRRDCRRRDGAAATAGAATAGAATAGAATAGVAARAEPRMPTEAPHKPDHAKNQRQLSRRGKKQAFQPVNTGDQWSLDFLNSSQ